MFPQYMLNTYSRQRSEVSSDLTACRQKLDSDIFYIGEGIFPVLFDLLSGDCNKIMNIISSWKLDLEGLLTLYAATGLTGTGDEA